MAALLDKLQKQVEKKVQERIGALEPKLDEMCKTLKSIDETLKKLLEQGKKDAAH